MIIDQGIVISLKLIVLFIYGAIFIVNIIFTFSINTYYMLEDVLSLDFLKPVRRYPFEKNIDFINDWLSAHNKIVGPMLIFLSLLDMVILFNTVDLLFR